MKLFFRCKTRTNELNWIDEGIIKYEYKSTKLFLKAVQFDLEIELNISFLKKDTIKYIRKWAQGKFEDEHFYREISFGIISDSKVIKEITFCYAYIYAFDEIFDYTENCKVIKMHIRQREDKAMGVKIFPKIIQQKIVSNAISNAISKSMPNLSQEKPIISGAKLVLNLKTKNVDLFKSKLSKQEGITPEHAKVLVKRFSCGSELAQNIFLKYVPNNSLKFVNFKKGNTYEYLTEERRIVADMLQDISNEHRIGNYYFHEHGHLIDLRKTKRDPKYPDVGTFSEDKEFHQLLRQDFEDYMQTYTTQNNVTRDVAYTQIAKTIGNYKHDIVCDLYGAMCENACCNVYNHKPEYWAARAIILPREAAAHFFEVQFDPERLKIVKNFFPKSMKKFEELLKMQN